MDEPSTVCCCRRLRFQRRAVGRDRVLLPWFECFYQILTGISSAAHPDTASCLIHFQAPEVPERLIVPDDLLLGSTRRSPVSSSQEHGEGTEGEAGGREASWAAVTERILYYPNPLTAWVTDHAAATVGRFSPPPPPR